MQKDMEDISRWGSSRDRGLGVIVNNTWGKWQVPNMSLGFFRGKKATDSDKFRLKELIVRIHVEAKKYSSIP